MVFLKWQDDWCGLQLPDMPAIAVSMVMCNSLQFHAFSYAYWLASFPGFHAQFLSLAVRKVGGRPGWIYHMMHATADVTFSLLISGFVLSPSLFFFWIQFVLSVQFVLRVRLLLDRSWLATVRDVSSGTHHVINPSRPSPCFSYCKRQ